LLDPATKEVFGFAEKNRSFVTRPDNKFILEGIQGRINKVAGDTRGSVFPKPPLRDMSPAEQSYGNYKQAYDRHTANYDWENVLKDKWGMHRNTGGNEPFNRTDLITEFIDRRSRGSQR
jgi:hypothetical protein